jgi:hypothetical protein
MEFPLFDVHLSFGERIYPYANIYTEYVQSEWKMSLG